MTKTRRYFHHCGVKASEVCDDFAVILKKNNVFINKENRLFGVVLAFSFCMNTFKTKVIATVLFLAMSLPALALPPLPVSKKNVVKNQNHEQKSTTEKPIFDLEELKTRQQILALYADRDSYTGIVINHGSVKFGLMQRF